MEIESKGSFKATEPKVISKKEPVDVKGQIEGLITVSISILHRNIHRKVEAIEKLQNALKLLRKL